MDADRRSLDVVLLGKDDAYLYVRDTLDPSSAVLRISYRHDRSTYEHFRDTLDLLSSSVTLKIVDVRVDDEGILYPEFYIVEPDYLLDCSALAECYKPYGHHPLNYILSRFQEPQTTLPMLLGNLVNLMIDECVNRPGEAAYEQIVRLFFSQQSLQIASCKEMGDAAKSHQFHQDGRRHLANIRKTISESFRQKSGKGLDGSDALLEPTYICPLMGLQGRLDYMQRQGGAFIETKSGKGDEYSLRGQVLPQENHRVQMLLYQAMLEYTLGLDHQKVLPYVLYTRYPLLYPVRSSWNQLKEVINLRNRIVMTEHRICQENRPEVTDRILRSIKAETLNERHQSGFFFNTYLLPGMTAFQKAYAGLDDLERAYFLEHYNFITRELYLSKSSVSSQGAHRGMSQLWRLSDQEKLERGEIIQDLILEKNHAPDPLRPWVLLRSSSSEPQLSAPNFRQGDAVILYRKDSADANATNQLVFKGTFEEVGDGSYRVFLRQSQSNDKVLPSSARYALEHDSMDVTFRGMYQSLGAFMGCPRPRRELILGLRKPTFDQRLFHEALGAGDDFQRIAQKAEAAEDLFLLIGPPGSGKTSRALKAMVERFFKAGKSILLVSYTNRAVDEICRMLEHLDGELDYIRIGNEQAADPVFRPRMLEQVLKDCVSRQDVLDRLLGCRVMVGTLSALVARSALFKIRGFDVALVDEATQIQESQMLGLLCQTDASGREAIGRFVLIGDHKQLPSVVLQDRGRTCVQTPQLRELGIRNFSESFFERMIAPYMQGPLTRERITSMPFYDMLLMQGRMNPDVARFANEKFYMGLLETLGLPHQVSELRASGKLKDEPHAPVLLRRVSFLDVDGDEAVPGNHALAKSSLQEAETAAQVARLVYLNHQMLGEEFNAQSTLGIIAPFRSQIALIRRQIRRLGIPKLEQVTVDTVERYQGSERDVIIYSFCVSDESQIAMMQNIIEEQAQRIDRKLNVALTRARRQIVLIGCGRILKSDPIYRSLIESASVQTVH